MKTETLSDKKEIDEILGGHGFNKHFRLYIISLFERKEKDFIQKLKEGIGFTPELELIDKLAGDALIHSPQDVVEDGIALTGGSIPPEDKPEVRGKEVKLKPIANASGTHGSGNASCTNNPVGNRYAGKRGFDSPPAGSTSDNKGCTNHKCVFSFEKKYVGKKGLYEPKKGETGFSIKRDDWVCRCGKTRREYLKTTPNPDCTKSEGCGKKVLSDNWGFICGETFRDKIQLCRECQVEIVENNRKSSGNQNCTNCLSKIDGVCVKCGLRSSNKEKKK